MEIIRVKWPEMAAMREDDVSVGTLPVRLGMNQRNVKSSQSNKVDVWSHFAWYSCVWRAARESSGFSNSKDKEWCVQHNPTNDGGAASLFIERTDIRCPPVWKTKQALNDTEVNKSGKSHILCCNDIFVIRKSGCMCCSSVSWLSKEPVSGLKYMSSDCEKQDLAGCWWIVKRHEQLESGTKQHSGERKSLMKLSPVDWVSNGKEGKT